MASGHTAHGKMIQHLGWVLLMAVLSGLVLLLGGLATPSSWQGWLVTASGAAQLCVCVGIWRAREWARWAWGGLCTLGVVWFVGDHFFTPQATGVVRAVLYILYPILPLGIGAWYCFLPSTREVFAKAREELVLLRYDRLASRASALDEIDLIAQYAVQGRVRDLLLERDGRVWGELDRATGEVEMHGKVQGKGGENLLDVIAEAVRLRGGDVWSLEKSRMPSKSPVAATLRW